jgi:hypothetical protein
MLNWAIGAACLCAATIAVGEPARLSGGEIRELVAGSTIEIDAPLGTKLPVRYARDGELSGEAGDLAPYLGAPSDSGRWWVRADELCHKWRRWFNSEPQCLRLRKEGRTIFWLSQDGNSGTAMIVVAAPVRTALLNPPEAPEGKMRLTAPEVPPTDAGAPLAPTAAPIGAEEQALGSQRDGLADARPAQPAPAATAFAGGAPAQPEPKDAVEPAFMVANVDADDVLNVRRGPSTEFEVIGELQPGSRGITITGACRSTWCPVQHQATTGWVNRIYLASEGPWPVVPVAQHSASRADAADAPRSCLTPPTRALLTRVEERFGSVQVVSTCRLGATIAGTGRPSRHASGNAVDFDAGGRKADIVQWLVANHHDGGTMTYPDMDHIHIDIGPHFVSIAARDLQRMRRAGGGDW